MPANVASNAWYYPVLITMILVGVFNIYRHYNAKPQVIVVDTVKNDIAFWEGIQNKYPTFRDAYIVLSKIKSQEGDVLGATIMQNEAMKIDPYITPDSL